MARKTPIDTKKAREMITETRAEDQAEEAVLKKFSKKTKRAGAPGKR